MSRQPTASQFKTVSEYVAAGGMATGLYLLENATKETEKAVAFSAVGANVYGYPCRKMAWIPKSKISKVANDFYTNEAPAEMWLVPGWLISAKKAEGLDVLETL